MVHVASRVAHSITVWCCIIIMFWIAPYFSYNVMCMISFSVQSTSGAVLSLSQPRIDGVSTRWNVMTNALCVQWCVWMTTVTRTSRQSLIWVSHSFVFNLCMLFVIQSFIVSIYLCIYVFSHSLTDALASRLIYLFIYLFIFIYLFVCLFLLFICLFAFLFVIVLSPWEGEQSCNVILSCSVPVYKLKKML